MRQNFITKCVSFLSQNATVITKCDVYYKLRQLLQNATFITNCDSTNIFAGEIFIYLLIFSDNKTKILAVCLSKSY